MQTTVRLEPQPLQRRRRLHLVARWKATTFPRATAPPASPTQFGYFYPEYLNYERRAPKGTLLGDQTHRLRAGSATTFRSRSAKLNATVLQAYDSGRAYSAIGNINAGPTAATGCGTPAATALREPDRRESRILALAISDSHTYYFSDRGAFRTDAVTSTDFSLNYRCRSDASSCSRRARC